MFIIIIDGLKIKLNSFLKILKHKYFITWFLFILIWSFAFAIGYFNMSQYNDSLLNLEHYDTFVQKLSCNFPSYLKPQYEYCTLSKFAMTNNSIDISIFVVLLVVPNLIIFLSYGYICYHIWSSGRRFTKKFINKKATAPTVPTIVVQEYSTIQQVDQMSILKPNELCLNLENEFDIQAAVSAASSTVGILNNAQIATISKLIQYENILKKSNNKSFEIDISYNAKYNAFEIEARLREKSLEKPKASMFKSNTMVNNNNMIGMNNYTSISNNMVKKRNKTVTLTVCLMAICFILCWAPFFSFPLFYSQIVDINTYINLKVAIHLIGYSSSIWIPLVYIIRCEKFRDSVKFFFGSIKLKLKSIGSSLCFKSNLFGRRKFDIIKKTRKKHGKTKKKKMFCVRLIKKLFCKCFKINKVKPIN